MSFIRWNITRDNTKNAVYQRDHTTQTYKDSRT